MFITSLILMVNLSFSDVCDSLSTLACAPGKFDDGTGSSPSESEVKRSLNRITESTRETMSAEFENLIKNPDNVYFRESAAQAFGLSEFPSCSGKTPKDVLDCNQNIVEGLTNLGEKILFNTSLSRVGDLESLNFIYANHLFASILEKATASAEKQIGAEPITRKIQNSIFPGVKNALVTKISSWPVSAQQKQLMISKLKSIRFDGSKCAHEARTISAMLTPNAYYNPQANTFSYCAGMIVQSSSEFTLAAIVAHELAHSIDPCNVSNSLGKMMGEQETAESLNVLDRQSPYVSLIQCLRGKESIGAESISGSNMEIPKESPGSYPMPQEENKNISFCRHDQIGESFCDWVAAEILSDFIQTRHHLTKDQYINGYANAFRPICDTFSDPAQKNSHPRSQDRIDKIFLANPKIRKDMGCPQNGKSVYCPFGKNAMLINKEATAPQDFPHGGKVEQ